jgi:hypothetical protein
MDNRFSLSVALQLSIRQYLLAGTVAQNAHQIKGYTDPKTLHQEAMW